jgi:hypothetical protein
VPAPELVTASARSWLLWGPTEPDLVAVGIAVRGLAHAVRVGFLLRTVESPRGDLRDARVEVSDEERLPGVSGVF